VSDQVPASDRDRQAARPEHPLVSAIKAHIAKGDKATEKAEQHYIAAGQHLKTLKESNTGTWAEWKALLKTKIGISTGRASELMQIADGRKTVEQIRDNATKRVRRLRSGSSLRNEESAGNPAASAEVKAALAEDDGRDPPPFPRRESSAEQDRIDHKDDDLVIAWDKAGREQRQNLARERRRALFRALSQTGGATAGSPAEQAKDALDAILTPRPAWRSSSFSRASGRPIFRRRKTLSRTCTLQW
jgi:hypothetical protein